MSAEPENIIAEGHHTMQELASSATIMRMVEERTHWRSPSLPMMSAIIRSATDRLEKPSSNTAKHLNAQNVLDIFHTAAVLGFHSQEGTFLQTVLKMLELRVQEFSAQVSA